MLSSRNASYLDTIQHFVYSCVVVLELRTSLEEHQSALELIMSKYREQMFRLLMASKKDDPGIIMKLKEQHSKVKLFKIL